MNGDWELRWWEAALAFIVLMLMVAALVGTAVEREGQPAVVELSSGERVEHERCRLQSEGTVWCGGPAVVYGIAEWRRLTFVEADDE